MRAFLVGLTLAFSLPVLGVESGGPMPDVNPAQLDDASKQVSLRAFKGNVVYVDFWASWCVPCKLSMPTLDALYRDNRGRGLVVVGINKDTAPAEAERFLKRVNVTFPLARDMNDAAARAFDVKAMPSGYLIDRRGVVRHVHRGFTAETAAALAVEIEALLKEPS